MILRAEKGYIVVGKDTDGTTMPHDLGVAGPRNSRPDEYIGKRSLFMPVASDPRRKQLVGLSVAPGEAPLPTGAHVTARRGPSAALAGLRDVELHEPKPWPPDRARPHRSRGCRAWAKRSASIHLGAERRATIASPVALDPEGKRLHA